MTKWIDNFLKIYLKICKYFLKFIAFPNNKIEFLFKKGNNYF